MIDGRHYSVSEVIKQMAAGVTTPWLCECEDGVKVVAKSIDELPPYQLVAEWVAGHLGVEFGIPVPGIRILDGLSNALSMLPDRPGHMLDVGPAFGSIYIENSADLQYSAIRNIDAKLKSDILIFDVWVKNDDRTLSPVGGNVNLLHRIDTKQLVVFDHNLAFDTTLDTAAIVERHVFSGENRGSDLTDWVERQDYEDRLARCYQQLDAIVDAMPAGWRTEATDQLIRQGRLQVGQDVIDDVMSPILLTYTHEDFWTEIRP